MNSHFVRCASEEWVAMQAKSEYNNNLQPSQKWHGSDVLETQPEPLTHTGGHPVSANEAILASSPDSANSLNHNREEAARQLLPLLQQFIATYSHADLSMTPLGESFRRILFNAQYHAMQGGVE